MKQFTVRIYSTLALTFAIITAVSAFATTSTLIPGVGMLFKMNNGKTIVSSTTTNDKGKTTSGKLAKGTYQLDFSKSQSSGSTPLYPFMLKLEGVAQVTVNGNEWDIVKAIKVEKGTTIKIIVKTAETCISATISTFGTDEQNTK